MANCIFCNQPFGSPDRERSKEHAYPRWLEKYWPGSTIRTYSGEHYGHGTGPAGLKRTAYTMPIGTYEQVVREVCVPCNNGWMERQLEAPAQTIMPPMFRREQVTLTYAPLAQLAAWAWKTAAMILQLSEKVSRAITPDEHQSFYRTRQPPYRSLVWLGEYERGTPPFDDWWAPWTTLMLPQGESPGPGITRNMYSIPFTIGNLFFLVFGTTSVFPSLGPRGALERRLMRIWPIAPGTSLVWPPSKPVTGELLARLIQSFRKLMPSGGDGLRNGVSGDVYGLIEP